MIHPHTTLGQISEKIGLGVLATRPIAVGTIVFVTDELDRVIPSQSSLLKDRRYSQYILKYSYREPNGDHVLSMDHAKYMNHSCDPNTLCTPWGFDIAVRDIPAGEELTCEYGLLNIESDMPCDCKVPLCRKVVCQNDIEGHYLKWDHILSAAFEEFSWNDQPLMALIDEGLRLRLTKDLRTGQGHRSVLELAMSLPSAHTV